MSKIFALVSRIREASNQLIIDELNNCGIKGIVPSHGDILHILSRSESCSMNEIAEKIHRTKPTVTVLVNKLLKLGLIEKKNCSEDARVSLIMLSNKCKALMPQINNISNILINTGLSGFSEKEEKNLSKYLERVFDNLNK